MIKKVLKQLDSWITQENQYVSTEGGLRIGKFTIKILGQHALFEAQIDLHLSATQDVDAKMNCDYAVKKKFNELLKPHGKHLDELSHEIWMPKETKYDDFYMGKNFKSYLAKPEYILLSKALKAPEKNKNLIIEYIAKGPDEVFLDLAKKYKVILEDFVQWKFKIYKN